MEEKYLEEVVHDEYLPYGKSVIVGRAIPAIDGLKPSQRRVIVAMSRNGLLGSEKKRRRSSTVNGYIGLLHPHGDLSCYETMVYMSQRRGGLNVPYVDGKGNFGDVREPEHGYAAARYTEARLTDICKYMVDGMEEGAVDMVDNFDGTLKEPVLLPVKFPNILVNSNAGIAVAVSSNVPSYSLRNVCMATAKVMFGQITTDKELAEVLGVPEFPTGGVLHANESELVELVKTGRGSFPLTATTEVYSDRIVAKEIPYTTSVESIKDAVEKAVKEKLIPEISDLKDEIGYGNFSITFKLKRGSDARDVLSRLYRLTPLRCNVSFNTCVIIGDEYKYIGIMELIQEWVKWRMQTIGRVYETRLAKSIDKESRISAWECIDGRAEEAAKFIVNSKNKQTAIAGMIKTFGMNEVQAQYIVEEKIFHLTQEGVEKHLEELRELRETIKEYKDIVENEEPKRKLILNDLVEISNTFATRQRTKLGEKLPERSEEVVEKKISRADVTIVYTKEGFIKRLDKVSTIINFKPNPGDEEVTRINIKNNEDILVLTTDGSCYKVLADDIDSSNGGTKVRLHNMLGLESKDDIVKVIPAGDYSQIITILYPSGKAQRVSLSKCSGKRRKYLSLYEPVVKDRFWIVEEDKFFIVTAPKGEKLKSFNGVKAVYVDFAKTIAFTERNKLRLVHVSSRDVIAGVVYLSKVARPKNINTEYYSKVYPCRIDIEDLVDIYGKSNKQESEQNENVQQEKQENAVTSESNSGEVRDAFYGLDIEALKANTEEDGDYGEDYEEE